jgi:hypothetical protein
MKALKMDAALAERKELATELHYTGDMQDSAAMNIWLHKALMKKRAENAARYRQTLRIEPSGNNWTASRPGVRSAGPSCVAA